MNWGLQSSPQSFWIWEGEQKRDKRTCLRSPWCRASMSSSESPVCPFPPWLLSPKRVFHTHSGASCSEKIVLQLPKSIDQRECPIDLNLTQSCLLAHLLLSWNSVTSPHPPIGSNPPQPTCLIRRDPHPSIKVSAALPTRTSIPRLKFRT